MHDLLVKGGRVIDPSQKVNGLMDVAVSGGRISGIGPEIPCREAQEVVDATGKIVVPGLIDLHTHVYDGFLNNGANPDVVGVNQGVTTLVDGGSAGQAIFAGFPRYVMPAARTDVYCFLHIGSFGLAALPELRCAEEIDAAATEALIRSEPDRILGIKLRLVGNLVAREGIAVVKTARETAGRLGLPLMVHIGDPHRQVPPSLTGEMLPLLRQGDILSHIYTGQSGGLLGEDGKVHRGLAAARDRGVVLDVSHGMKNFTFSTARKMMDQEIFPTTVSTDISRPSVTAYVFGLTVAMSKFLEMGLPLEDIVAMTTVHPARAAGISGRKGSLKPAMDADISILEIRPGRWRFQDISGGTLVVSKLIRPFLTVKAGVPVPPRYFPVPEEDLPR